MAILLAWYGQDNNAIQATLTWDAENRLIRHTPTAPVEGSQKVHFKYDYLGRRVEKLVYDWVVDPNDPNSGAWEMTPSLRRRFVWYNWLLLEELDVDASGTVTGVAKKYTWGLDLAGLNGSVNDIESAGGIGGLLGTLDVGTSTSYIHFYDANGNVGQVVDVADGSLAAKYEYDAYGNNLLDPADPQQSGPYAADNPIRFSTKYFDDETELYYYGYRYYLSRLGRWISREPNEEDGGALLYGYVSNAPSRRTDPLGLCCNKEDCNKKLRKALQDPAIKKMIEEAKKLKHWWGMPCCGRVRCTCLCGKRTYGWADPISGDALVCARNASCLSQSQFNDVVREEIAHHMLMCGNINDWLWSCKGCMREEKRAKYLAGLCRTDGDCTRQAWSSCWNHLGCRGKTWKDFLGVGWPPDLEGQKPVCTGGCP